MAKKQSVIDSDLDVESKVVALISCISQETKVEATRLIKDTGLSLMQLSILHSLSESPEEGMTINQLKEAMLDEASNVSRATKKLVDAGYVTKHRADEDQRIVQVRITPEGEKAHIDADELVGVISLNLPEADIQQLYQLLLKI